MCGCLLTALYRGPGLKPRHVPWLGIKTTTLWFAGQRSIHWATPARADFLWVYLSQTDHICWGARSQMLPKSTVSEKRIDATIFHGHNWLFWSCSARVFLLSMFEVTRVPGVYSEGLYLVCLRAGFGFRPCCQALWPVIRRLCVSGARGILKSDGWWALAR